MCPWATFLQITTALIPTPDECAALSGSITNWRIMSESVEGSPDYVPRWRRNKKTREQLRNNFPMRLYEWEDD